MYDSTEQVLSLIDDVLDRYQDMVYRLALNQTRNEAAAETVFQEVFIRYVTYLETASETPAFSSVSVEKTWLLKTTIEVTLNHMNKPTFVNGMIPLPAALQQADATDRALYEAVWKLPSKYRLIVHLFYYEEMSTDEIGILLSLKQSTIRERIMKAVRLLKKLLKGDYNYV